MSEYLNISNIIECPRYIICRYYYEKASYLKIFDRSTGTVHNIGVKPQNQAKWITDDLAGGVDIEIKTGLGGKFYSWVDALLLRMYVESDKFKNSEVIDSDKKKHKGVGRLT